MQDTLTHTHTQTYTHGERNIALEYKPCLQDKSPLPRCNNCNNERIKIIRGILIWRGEWLFYTPHG